MTDRRDMSCQALTELAPAYGDADLNATATAAVRDHLAGCAGCRSYLAQLRATRKILRTMGDESLEPRYRERLFAAFHRSR
jgi:anti-sigma factor RsiW